MDGTRHLEGSKGDIRQRDRGKHPENTLKMPENTLKLETSLPGALYREFPEFIRVLTTFLGRLF